MTPIFTWPERQTHVVTANEARFVLKLDDDHQRLAREAAGQREASALGVPVPELIAEEAGALVMRFVDGLPLTEHAPAAAVVDTGKWLRVMHDCGPLEPDYDGHTLWSDGVEAWLDPELDGCVRDGHIGAGRAEEVRGALDDAREALDAHRPVWCHGDFQAAHVLADPATGRVSAILDFADHRTGEPGWDVGVFTIYDEALIDPLLDGYDASATLRDALTLTLPLYRVLRLLGSVRWLAERDHPAVDDHLARIHAWKRR